MNETMMTIVGNVTGDLKARRTADGVRVVTFRVASNERRFDRATGEWIDGDSLFMTVVCWRKLALGVMGSLAKGDPVVVSGRLYTRGYEVEGQRRSVTELEATTVGPDLSRCTAEVRRNRNLALADAAGGAGGTAPAGSAPEPGRGVAGPDHGGYGDGAPVGDDEACGGEVVQLAGVVAG